jgi:hypothetical protein
MRDITPAFLLSLSIGIITVTAFLIRSLTALRGSVDGLAKAVRDLTRTTQNHDWRIGRLEYRAGLDPPPPSGG